MTYPIVKNLLIQLATFSRKENALSASFVYDNFDRNIIFVYENIYISKTT